MNRVSRVNPNTTIEGSDISLEQEQWIEKFLQVLSAKRSRSMDNE